MTWAVFLPEVQRDCSSVAYGLQIVKPNVKTSEVFPGFACLLRLPLASLLVVFVVPLVQEICAKIQFNVDESLHELVLAIRFHELESPPAPAIHPKKKEHKSCSCSIL
ncbi:RRAS2: Ras-related protein R-Ras2 [Crotalus adamanteus]|uniref:RRAS2: Ras-related protein R-Ras2 n=1 Tax=Crotalus adamanteus TaxID=8729 RepID=A0AAW1B0V7_CROAD